MVTTKTGVDPDAPTFTERYIAPITSTAKRTYPSLLLAVTGAIIPLAPAPFSCIAVVALILAIRK